MKRSFKDASFLSIRVILRQESLHRSCFCSAFAPRLLRVCFALASCVDSLLPRFGFAFASLLRRCCFVSLHRVCFCVCFAFAPSPTMASPQRVVPISLQYSTSRKFRTQLDATRSSTCTRLHLRTTQSHPKSWTLRPS